MFLFFFLQRAIWWEFFITAQGRVGTYISFRCSWSTRPCTLLVQCADVALRLDSQFYTSPMVRCDPRAWLCFLKPCGPPPPIYVHGVVTVFVCSLVSSKEKFCWVERSFLVACTSHYFVSVRIISSQTTTVFFMAYWIGYRNSLHFVTICRPSFLRFTRPIVSSIPT